MRVKAGIRHLLSAAYERWTAIYWQGRYEDYRARYQLDRSFRFNGHEIVMFGDGRIVAGAGTYIGRGCTLYAHEGTTIELGDKVGIAANVRIDTQSAFADQDRSGELDCKVGSVRVGARCWIGVNVYVGPGVSVGENSVIAANSVVVRDVPANTVVRPAVAELRPQTWP